MSGSSCCFLDLHAGFAGGRSGDLVFPSLEEFSNLLKSFPQFVVIHTVKGFGIVNKADAFSGILLLFLWSNRCSLVPLPFLNPVWTSGIPWFTCCWSLAWRILSITLLACEMSAIVSAVVLTFFGIAFLWDWNENWPFLVLWPLLSFPNLLAYWVQHFHRINF